jgi:hypothetical protein
MNALGSFCFRVRTGAKRSPSFFTRFRVSLGEKYRLSLSFFFAARSSSSHVTGTEINGSSRLPRIEYTHTVVFACTFCDQSIITRPFRSAFAISLTINLGCRLAINSATDLAKGVVAAYVTGVFSGT